MIGISSRNSGGGIDSGVETSDALPTLKVINLFDAREKLTNDELTESMEHIDSVMGMIIEEGKSVTDNDLRWLPDGEDEIYLAREISGCRKAVDASNSHLGRLLSGIVNNCKSLDGSNQLLNDINEFRRSIPNIKISELRRIITLANELSPSLIEVPETLLDPAKQLTKDYVRLTVLTDQKNKFLIREMAQLTEDEETRIRNLITEVIFSIQACRKERGDPLYPRDAIIMLTYEIIYEAYLWRKKTRKSGEATFDTHLIGAIRTSIANGRTGLTRLGTLMKHDSGEDLLIHQPDCEKHASERDLKNDWFYCSDLYLHHLSNHPIPDGNGGEIMPREQALIIIRDSITTIRGMTNPPANKEGSSDDIEAARLRIDIERTSHIFEEMVDNPHVTANKALEQGNNSGTLKGLGAKRGCQKWKGIILACAVIARSQGLQEAYNQLVGGGIDFFDEVKEKTLRADYNRLQRDRISKFLSINNSGGSSVLSRLTRMSDSSVSDETIDCGDGSFEDIMSGWGDAFATCFDGIDGITAIQIIPTPLEHYIDLSRLNEKDYIPEIPDTEPLFHILVLTDDRAQITSTKNSVDVAMAPDLTSSSGPMPSYPDQAPKGILMHLEDHAFGGPIQIRINKDTDEARLKAGNITGENPMPAHQRAWLLQAMKFAAETGTPVLDAIRRHVFRSTIAVTTNTAENRRTVLLPDGATGLDLAAHLPMTPWAKALTCGSGYNEQYPRASSPLTPGVSRYISEKARLLEPPADGDFVLLTHSEEPIPQASLLARLACCEDPRAGTMAARYFTNHRLHDAIYDGDTSTKKTRLKAHVNRALDYLRTIVGPVFGLEDDELMIFACMHLLEMDPIGEGEINNDEAIGPKLEELRDVIIASKHEAVEPVKVKLEKRLGDLNKEIERSVSSHAETLSKNKFARQVYLAAREKMLHRIGNGNFDPLRMLSLYFDRSVPLRVTFTAEQVRDDVLADVYLRGKALGLVAGPEQVGEMLNATESTFTIEWDMSKSSVNDHDLLKFILTFHDDPTVNSVRLNSPNIQFPSCFEEVSKVINPWANIEDMTRAASNYTGCMSDFDPPQYPYRETNSERQCRDS